MSDPQKPAVIEQTIREVQPGVVGAASEIGRTLIAALPPSFIMLCVLNGVFLYAMMTFIQHQFDQRAVFANKIMDQCMAQGQLIGKPHGN